MQGGNRPRELRITAVVARVFYDEDMNTYLSSLPLIKFQHEIYTKWYECYVVCYTVMGLVPGLLCFVIL
jgi:hypothetical protein